MSKRDTAKGDRPRDGLGDDPLSGTDALLEALYNVEPARPEPTRGEEKTSRRRSRARQPLPDGKTFRLVTFSFYEEDVERLDALLAAAKKKGHRKVSRSQIVRLALRQVDIEDLPDTI